MSNKNVDPTILFETSWEVCNKVGGIYTVLSSKAKVQSEQLGDKMIFIGPDVWSDSTPSPFFEESKTSLDKWAKSVDLPYGIKIRVGRWNIPSKPTAILVKFDGLYPHLNSFFSFIWEKFGVDSLHAYGDYNEGCAFAIATAIVMKSCAAHLAKADDRVVAHFNEWTTGMGLLYLKAHAPEIATVFTTHATSIGRSICGNGKPLYDYFNYYNGDQMAAELNMQSKHSLEKTAAHNADCFTTVSEITARECEQLLDIKPLVTPNGFELALVPDAKKHSAQRKSARAKLLKVAEALTGKKISDGAFLYATAGRNEYRNKGLDMFIDSLNALRHQEFAGKRDIIAFILVPAWENGCREDLKEKLTTNDASAQLENPIITHKLHNYSSDSIYNRLCYLGFNNAPSESVNVIYVPCYLNGTDGIFDKSYYELLPGFDATVFASYYEPWGYTPHEGIAFGVPTITTDLAGFGQWILSTFGGGFSKCGTEVIHRNDSNYDMAVGNIVEKLKVLIESGSAESAKIRKAAKAASKMAIWESFIKYYDIAYSNAIINNSKKQLAQPN